MNKDEDSSNVTSNLKEKMRKNSVPEELIKEIYTVLDENTGLKKQLEEETSRNQEFFNDMSVGYFRIDKDENYTIVNEAYANICGYKREEMLVPGFNIDKIWAIAEEKHLLLMEAQRKELRGIIINYKRKDGTEGSQELFLKARMDEDGNLLGYDGYARDVSKRLNSLNAEVEARRRAEFLVDLMSHDINNIDQGILMILEYILLDEKLPEGHREPIKMAVEQVNYATELIKNVKKLQVVLEEPVNSRTLDPYRYIVDASEAAKRAFPHKSLEIKIQLKEGELLVMADDFLKDLFFNVFHNALKHSNSDKVRLDISQEPSKLEGMIEIHVCDNGPGIPDQEKKRILQRRLGAKGSGIGLTIVNYLLDRYEGFVQVRDRIEGDQKSGSRFIIVLHKGD